MDLALTRGEAERLRDELSRWLEATAWPAVQSWPWPTEGAYWRHGKGFRWSQSTVARVEGGKRPVQFAEVAALADLLDIQHGSYWERGPNEPPW